MKKGNIHSLEDDYYLNEVVPHYISDSVLTPGESPTPTNVGVVLAKRVHPSDDSYGTHASKYSGIGYEKIDHPDFISTPRTIAHMRTGVHWDISESTSSPRHRQFLAAKNKAFFAQPIKELGNDIFQSLKRDKQIMETHSSKKENVLFPKSRVYDYEYIRDEYYKKLKAKQEALQKSEVSAKEIVEEMPKKTVPCTPGSLLKLECADFEKNKPRPTSLPWWPDPPYWYDSKQADRNPIPSRNVNEFTIPKMPESIEEHNWLEEMELDNTKNYIPGEIYKNITPKQAVEDLSKSGSCNKEWKPRIEEASAKIFDVKNMQNEKALEKEVERRRVMEYSESLGLDKPKPMETIPFKNPCKVRNRQKKTTTCACGTCQCILDARLGILVTDPCKNHVECGCVICHVAKYRSIKTTIKKPCCCISFLN